MVGDMQVAGTEIAVREINAKGGIDGVPLRVIYEDNQANPTTAITAFQKLISVDKVPLAFTTYATTQLAQAPLATKNKVIMVNVGAASPELINCTPYMIHVQPNMTDILKVAFNYVCQTLGFNKGPWASLYLNASAEYKADNRYLVSMLAKYGVKDVFQDTWPDYSSTDFRPIITKALTTKPTAFFVGGTLDAGLCLKQLREAGFKGPVILPYDGLIAKTAGVGIYNTYHGEQIIPENKRIQDMRKEALNVKKIQAFGAQTVNNYDAVYLVAEAIKYAKDHYKGDYFTGEKLLQAMMEKRKFDTLSIPGTLDAKTKVLSRQLSVKTFVDQQGNPVPTVVKVYSLEEMEALPKGEIK
jgi:branched-chain amino acid transport system substrate-binding protein